MMPRIVAMSLQLVPLLLAGVLAAGLACGKYGKPERIPYAKTSATASGAASPETDGANQPVDEAARDRDPKTRKP